MRALKYFVNEAAESLLRSWRSAVLAVLTIAAGSLRPRLLPDGEQQPSARRRPLERSGRDVDLPQGRRDARASAGARGDHRAERPDRRAPGTCRRPTHWRDSARTFPTSPARPSGSSAIRCRHRSRFASGAARGRRRPSVDELAARLGSEPGVADVRYDRRWLSRLGSAVRFVRTDWPGRRRPARGRRRDDGRECRPPGRLCAA